MKQDLTHLVVILDRSGSMEAIKSDMEGGLANFLNEQKKVPGECRLTFVKFDNQYELIADYVDLRGTGHFELDPRGATALLDAMGRTINDVGIKLRLLPEDERPAQVIVVTVTDGEENDSSQFKHEEVMNMIARQQADYGWQFVYLGANQDAIAVGGALGVFASSSLNYNTNDIAVASAFTATSAAVTRSRNSGESISYTDEEREAAATTTGSGSGPIGQLP